jgi:hypothetical protein
VVLGLLFSFGSFFCYKKHCDTYAIVFLFICLLFTLLGFFMLVNTFFWYAKYKNFKITSSHTFFGYLRGRLLSVFVVGYLLSFSGFPFFLGFLAKGTLAYFFISTWIIECFYLFL